MKYDILHTIFLIESAFSDVPLTSPVTVWSLQQATTQIH